MDNFNGFNAIISVRGISGVLFMRYLYLSAQYSENIVVIMFNTTSALVKSVAVISMKIFLVFKVILLWLPLIIGGNERTRFLASKITG